MGWPLLLGMEISANSSAVPASPMARTFCSLVGVSMRPAGISECSRVMAATTSSTVNSWAVILSASSHTRKLGATNPPSETSPTPLMVANWSCKWSWTYFMSSRGVPSPCRVSQMMGCWAGLTLVTVGGSMSLGKDLWTWDIFVCTSWTATSTLRSNSSSTVTVARPWRTEEEMSRTPSREVNDCSTMSTTLDSMTSGAAPCQVRFTEMTGNSTSGNWLTPMPLNPIAPNTIRAAMNIQANTGRLMDRSESVMADIPGFDLKLPIEAPDVRGRADGVAAHVFQVCQRLQNVQIIDEIIAVVSGL